MVCGALRLLEGAVLCPLPTRPKVVVRSMIVPLVDNFRASWWLSWVRWLEGGASPIHSSEQGVLGKLRPRMRCTAPWTRAGYALG